MSIPIPLRLQPSQLWPVQLADSSVVLHQWISKHRGNCPVIRCWLLGRRFNLESITLLLLLLAPRPRENGRRAGCRRQATRDSHTGQIPYGAEARCTWYT